MRGAPNLLSGYESAESGFATGLLIAGRATALAGEKRARHQAAVSAADAAAQGAAAQVWERSANALRARLEDAEADVSSLREEVSELWSERTAMLAALAHAGVRWTGAAA